MLFWLKKALTVPFLPLYFCLLAGTLGCILLFTTRWKKWGRALLVVAIAALALFSNKGVARLLIEPLEGQYAPLPEAESAAQLPPEAAACEAIIVLGGGHGTSPQLAAVNQLSSSALARLAEGIRLARLLPRAKLVLSGYNGADAQSHAQVLANAAESLGIARERMQRFDFTRDTDDEARAVKNAFGNAPVLIVTSAWHMPRAMALCKRAGVNAVAAPTDYLLRPGADSGMGLLSFDLGALERSTKAIHERLGYFWSKLRKQI